MRKFYPMKKYAFLNLLLHFSLASLTSQRSNPFIYSLNSIQNRKTLNSLVLLDDEESMSKLLIEQPNEAVRRNLEDYTSIDSSEYQISISKENLYLTNPENLEFFKIQNHFDQSEELQRVEDSEFDDYNSVIFKPSLENLPAHSFSNTKTLNEAHLRNTDSMKKWQIFSDLKEFISKLIYFREEFNEFINNHFEFPYVEFFDTSIDDLIKNNPEYDPNLFRPKDSNLIIKNIMLLVLISIDLANKTVQFFDAVDQYDYLSLAIFNQRKKIKKLNSIFSDHSLNQLKFQNDLKELSIELSNLESQRKSLPKSPSFRIIYKYARHISCVNPKFGRFSNHWISTFVSFVKIVNFYEQKLKGIVDLHLDKFRCPFSFKHREALISQNSYIDTKSINFVILEWIFYFFSSDFQEQQTTETFNSSILLSRLTTLIIILLNEPEAVKMVLSKDRSFDNWKSDLKRNIKVKRPDKTSKEILKKFIDDVKGLKWTNDISENEFYKKIRRNYKLSFLDKVEQTVEAHILSLYESASSSFAKKSEKGELYKRLKQPRG